MADIDIQQKRGGSPFPWIIGLVVLALIGWGLYEMSDRDEAELSTVGTQDEAALSDGRPAVGAAQPTGGAGFLAWVRDSTEAGDGQTGDPHAYTREGMRRMVTALEGLVARDRAPEIERQFEAVREQVRLIEQSEPTSTDHADRTREAFLAGTQVMEMLRQRPHLQQADLQQPVQAARQAAEAVRPNTPLLEQRAAVERFFQQMAEAIERAERHAQS